MGFHTSFLGSTFIFFYQYLLFPDNVLFPFTQYVSVSSKFIAQIDTYTITKYRVHVAMGNINWCVCVSGYECRYPNIFYKMAAIFQTTISNAFSLIRMYKFRLIFHWSLLPRVQLTIFQHWFRWWLGAVQATSHYLNQCWHSLLTHICVIRPQWGNTYKSHVSDLIAGRI